MLTEKGKKFEVRKVLELPWAFWCIQLFSLFQTSTASVFLQNATELAEQRFNVDSITAGWYSATSQYAGFFLVPLIGLFVDVFGQRISALAFCGTGTFLAMLLLCFGSTKTFAAGALGVFALAVSFGPTTIIDSIRTTMLEPGVFGSAYALKITMNNAMNIIVRVITGVIQDRDNDSYDNVVIVYAVDAGLAMLVSLMLITIAWKTIDLRHLQWSRKKRSLRAEKLMDRREKFYGKDKQKNQRTSMIAFGANMSLVLGAWCAYFWGVATGNNE
jgi:MFS family permease